MPIESTHFMSDVSALTPLDIARGLELSGAAGWNQTEADWSVMLRLGSGYGIRDSRGRLLASSIVLPYQRSVGWISMVLVDESVRRRGVATRLFENAVAILRRGGFVPMVDATPAGREVYRRLGFIEVAHINRWRGQGAGRLSQVHKTLSAEDIEAGIALDEIAFGASRRSLLLELAGRPKAVTLGLPAQGAQLWSRAGRNATQIGPVIAMSERDAATLCVTALDTIAGPVLLDVPDSSAAIVAVLTDRGFTIERPLIRMALGSTPVSTFGGAMRVIAGPELG